MAGEPSSTHDVFFLDLSESRTTEVDSGLLLEALRESRIRTFTIDDEELLTPTGDEITPALSTAIEASKIAIVVVTGGYRDVSLRRRIVLAYILRYFRWNPQLIIPVFYMDRSPEKRKKYRQKTGKDVCKMSIVLAQVENLPGWDFNWYKNDIDEFNGKIASQVSKMLNRAPLYVTVYPVGLESRLEEVWRLLRLKSSNREFLSTGFYGNRGIGKSILARAVFNSIAHLFEVSCFLPNIRQNSDTLGLVGVQKMLLSQISGETDIQLENVSEGVSMIKDRLRQKDVLLILDDVDSLEQLEVLGRGPGWRFSSGSRLIITTRDKHLLTFHGNDMLLYDVQALNDKDALELLSHRAFEHGNVDPRYKELLNRAIRYASGLPLVLDMIGCSWKGKSADECGKALDRLERIRIPRDDIQRIQGGLTYNDIQSIKGASTTSRSDPEALHIIVHVPEETPLIDSESSQKWMWIFKAGVTSQMDFQKWMWILVCVVSCGVGLTCNALSSFEDEEKNRWWWPLFMSFPYVVVALAVLAVLATILRLNRYVIIRRLEGCIHYGIFVVIIVYSEFYNKFVETSITSIFSNFAFAVTSLSLSILLAAESENGMFTCFLGFFIIQLMTFHWYLLFVGLIVGAVLFDFHSSSESFLLTRIFRRFPAIPPRNLNE